jgi:ParB-like chromosome segregation protein Spo0J
MNLVPVRDSHLGYIPVSQIVDDNLYRFRRPNAESVEGIRASLVRSGQTHPMLLEAMSDGAFRVLDGHRRLAAARAVIAAGGTWHKLLAHVVLAPRAPSILRWLYARNEGERGYGPTERGRLFSWAQGAGMEIRAIARETGLTLAEVQDLIDLAEAPEELAELIDRAGLDTIFASMLYQRFRAWRMTRNGPLAVETAARIIDQGKKSPLTVKGWRFLLDFFWSHDTPFMIPAGKSDKC